MLPSRFWEQVVIGPNGCWLWAGNKDTRGYGQIRMSGVQYMVHRLSYEEMVGPIPQGLHLDHLCRTPLCVNPEHLDPVPPKVNALRGESPWAKNARKVVCPKGHEYTGTNKRGSRVCHTCTAEANRRYRQRLKEKDV